MHWMPYQHGMSTGNPHRVIKTMIVSGFSPKKNIPARSAVNGRVGNGNINKKYVALNQTVYRKENKLHKARK